MVTRLARCRPVNAAFSTRPTNRFSLASIAFRFPCLAANGTRVLREIESQGIITRDNVSVGVSAVAYYRVEDAVRSIVAIENVSAAISQIAQTTLRAVVGRHTLDETLSKTDKINENIREILDVQTED